MRYKEYIKLLKIRRIVAYYVPLLMIFGFIFLQNSYFTRIIYFFFVFIILYITGFWFLSKNICPWCGDRFFGTGALSDKKLNWHLFIGKKCQHCNQPNNKIEINKLDSASGCG